MFSLFITNLRLSSFGKFSFIKVWKTSLSLEFEMAILGRRYMILQLFIIHLFCCLGWLCNVALAQLETVTGSANFPDIGIAVVGNLAVFITSLLRGRLDLEMGARDVLATLRGPELYPINKGFGLTTCKPNQEDRFGGASVVMLSYNTPNSSMRQFMRYICNAYKVDSILLQCFPLKSKSADYKLLSGLCNCTLNDDDKSKCNCIVFWNVKEIVTMLAHRMPGTLKRLSDSLCLLPCPECLHTGCHGCNQGQLYVEETEESGRKILTPDDTQKGKKAVEQIFEYISQGDMKDDLSCICIPLSPKGYDYWTKLLTRSFGVTGEPGRNYSTASLIVPRLTEISLNFLLTVWFRVDGFSSSIVARRAIKDYVVDSKGSGFSAAAFLVKVVAKSNNDCRVLNFRGRLGIRSFSYIVGSVNLICSVFWAMLVALQGSKVGKWYDNHSQLPNKPRVAVIMIAIGIALFLDCLHLYLYWNKPSDSKEDVSSDSKEQAGKADSKDDGSSDSKNATGNVLFLPIVMFWGLLKAWLHPIVQVWDRLNAWLHVSDRLKALLHPILQVWNPLKVLLHSIIQVWHRLKIWFSGVLKKERWHRLKIWFSGVLKKEHLLNKVMVSAVIVLESVSILSGSVVLGILGPKCFGRWLYSILQVLVWIKWAVGSYLLGEYPPEYDSQGYEYDNGVLVYSSAFLLNSILAGVRGQWEYSTSFKNLN